jgi:uncharacterized protein
MTELSRDLAEEFPDKAEAIHALKISDAHFRTLLERNHSLWLEIKNIQSGQHPASDETLEKLEKQRLAVLDQIANMLAKAQSGS